jgi:hypothetical protein
MPHMLKDYESWVGDDGNYVMVPNPSESIFTTTLVRRANAQVPKSWSVDERLDPQHGEVQRQVCFPQSFVLTNTIPNPMGVSTPSGMSRKTSSSIPRSKAPTI